MDSRLGATDLLVLVILAGQLALTIIRPELSRWWIRDRWTGRPMSSGHITAILTLVLIVALVHDFG